MTTASEHPSPAACTNPASGNERAPMRAVPATLEDVRYELDGPVARVIIDRPAKGNSFRFETLKELTACIQDAGDRSGVRAIVLSASGDRFFSTGGDVKDYHERYRHDVAAFRTYQLAIEATLQAMLQCPRPIIARVNGDVVGGANAFHLAADLVVASETAHFHQIGAKIGSVSGLGPAQWWPLVVGDRRARELLLRARPLDARTALKWGAINDVVPYEGLDEMVQTYVDDLAAGFPDALRYARIAMNAGKEGLMREISQAREWLTMHFPSAESVEGFDAFIQKRPVDRTLSWHAADQGKVTVAPWGSAIRKCDACGAAGIADDHQFCGLCGARLEDH